MQKFPEITRSARMPGSAQKIQALFRCLKWTDGICVLTRRGCSCKLWTSRGYVEISTISDEDTTLFGQGCKGALVCVKYDASATKVPLWNVVSGQHNDALVVAYCGSNRLVSMWHRGFPQMKRQLMVRTGDVIEIPKAQFRSWVVEDLVPPRGECFVAVMVDTYRRVLVPRSLGGPAYHFQNFVAPGTADELSAAVCRWTSGEPPAFCRTPSGEVVAEWRGARGLRAVVALLGDVVDLEIRSDGELVARVRLERGDVVVLGAEMQLGWTRALC